MPQQDNWPADWHERIEAKIDAYHTAIHGDPQDPNKPGIDGRLRALEWQWGMVKKAAVSIATLGLPSLYKFIKAKLGSE